MCSNWWTEPKFASEISHNFHTGMDVVIRQQIASYEMMEDEKKKLSLWAGRRGRSCRQIHSPPNHKTQMHRGEKSCFGGLPLISHPVLARANTLWLLTMGKHSSRPSFAQQVRPRTRLHSPICVCTDLQKREVITGHDCECVCVRVWVPATKWI